MRELFMNKKTAAKRRLSVANTHRTGRPTLSAALAHRLWRLVSMHSLSIILKNTHKFYIFESI
jgi:hypothetical protein